MSAKPSTPMCDLLSARSGDRSTISDFLDWLNEQGIMLGQHEQTYGAMYPIGERADAMILRYLGIDATELERERRALLDSIQERP